MSLLEDIAAAADDAAALAHLFTDTIVIGGDRSPGRCEVRGWTRTRNWEKQKGYGVSGATLRFTGDDLAEGELVFTFWEPATQLPLWEIFAAKWFSTPKTKPDPKSPGGKSIVGLDIKHPILNSEPLRVHAIVPGNLGQLEQSDDGNWTCVVKCIEYRKPIATPLGTVDRAIPDVTPQPTAQDAASAEQDSLLAEKARLAKELLAKFLSPGT